MLTQLDLGSPVSRHLHRTRGAQEKLLAELFLRPHLELTEFYTSLRENGSLGSLCSSPIAGQSLMESLHEKVRPMKYTKSIPFSFSEVQISYIKRLQGSKRNSLPFLLLRLRQTHSLKLTKESEQLCLLVSSTLLVLVG